MSERRKLIYLRKVETSLMKKTNFILSMVSLSAFSLFLSGCPEFPREVMNHVYFDKVYLNGEFLNCPFPQGTTATTVVKAAIQLPGSGSGATVNYRPVSTRFVSEPYADGRQNCRILVELVATTPIVGNFRAIDVTPTLLVAQMTYPPNPNPGVASPFQGLPTEVHGIIRRVSFSPPTSETRNLPSITIGAEFDFHRAYQRSPGILAMQDPGIKRRIENMRQAPMERGPRRSSPQNSAVAK